MSYSFSADDATVQAALRRIGCEQVDKALAATGLTPDQSVHAARKSVKKLRALIRLVRPGLAAFKAENRALRDIGRRLSPLRDASVAAGLFDRLAAAEALPPAERQALAAALQDRVAVPGDAADRLQAALADCAALRLRAKHWKLAGHGFRALAGGLEACCDASRKAMAVALDVRSGPAVHDWRKRVKDQWYHARLLAPIWPEAMAARIAAAGRLGEMLGEHQDLVVLAGHLAEVRPEASAARIIARARHRCAGILAEAEPLARRIDAEPGAALAARWAVWWQATRPALPAV